MAKPISVIRNDSRRMRRGGQSARSNAPTTPIPPRASANPTNHSKVASTYPRSYTSTRNSPIYDVAHLSTSPQPAIWQYETPRYASESSLAALSPVIAEADALRRTPVDEIDTLPPPVSFLHKKSANALHTDFAALSDIDTAPLVFPHAPQHALSSRSFVFVPLDHLRWWLLSPGRLEFILRLGGTLLLLCLTGAFVLVIVVSLGIFSPGGWLCGS